MSFDFTPFARPGFVRQAKRTDSWAERSEDIQRGVLEKLIKNYARTEYGRRFGLNDPGGDAARSYAGRVPLAQYEDLRPYVMRMVNGEKDILWPGRCNWFAQSSGTSGGQSKFIPITEASLKGNHYRGGADTVAHYLRQVPGSRMFAGKGLILGGSFGNTLGIDGGDVHIGDLSATLISRINPVANLFRVPDKKTALLPDWEQKLPALVNSAAYSNITNISGVPSWFLTVLRRIMELRGVDKISDAWPGLEVFFHGGISFAPYRDEYRKITDSSKMHFLETYNASEGFFAVQNDFPDPGMLLIIDADIFYEFIPVDGHDRTPRPLWELEAGRVYELVISSSNGLMRYSPGDTVRVTSTNPVKITVAGRTHSFINAFGEELMEDNAERAMALACAQCGAAVANYTAAPVFARDDRKGRHQWLVEWRTPPADINAFAKCLDDALRSLNSDYDAKRSHSIFLDSPEIVTARRGLFEAWLTTVGTRKLGGQRKVPRLSNDRRMIDDLLKLNDSTI